MYIASMDQEISGNEEIIEEGDEDFNPSVSKKRTNFYTYMKNREALNHLLAKHQRK